MKKNKIIKIIVAVLSLTFVICMLSLFSSAKNVFVDVNSKDWFYDSVNWALEKNITNGIDPTHFAPNASCTRAEVVTFLWRSFGKPQVEGANNPFIDVREKDYFYQAVLWAVEKNITNGTDATHFSPKSVVTREQFVTFLWRSAGMPASRLFTQFDDAADTTEYYYTAVLWAYSNDITNGIDENTFGVGSKCTRGHTVTFLHRYDLSRPEITNDKVDSIKINGNDISDYVIAFDDDGGVMNNAANQLQKYIKSTVGTELSIHTGPVSKGTKRIYIKNEEVENNEEAYKYFTDEDGLVISGSSIRGALYGVFNFLEEQIGWRFFAEDYEVCIYNGDINLSEICETYVPYFFYRNVYDLSVLTESKTEISVKRMLNGEFVRSIPKEWGGMVKYEGGHTIGYLSETSWNGRDPNPCPYDENIYQTVLKNVLADLKNNPNQDVISVAQNDTAAHCECEKCQAAEKKYGSPSGAVIEFVNRIAREIKTEYPNTLVHTFAYIYTVKPPVGIECEDNVMVQICTGDNCFDHAFNDENCELNKEFQSYVDGWSKICKHIFVWDYVINFSYHQCPVPNFDNLLANVRYFHENNTVGIFEQSDAMNEGSEFTPLRTYLLCKCIENPYMTDEEYYHHMDEFLKYYYGDGWESIRQYIDLIVELANGRTWNTSSSPEEIYGEHAFTPYSDQIIKWWDKALEYAQNEKQILHIRKVRAAVDYLRIGSVFRDYKSSGIPGKKDWICQQAVDLFNDMTEFIFEYLGDHTLLPKGPINRLINPRKWGTGEWTYPYRE